MSSRSSISAICGSSSPSFSPARSASAAGVDFEIVLNGALDVGGALSRGLQLRFAARLLLARGAHRVERGAGGAVGFREPRFGARPGVGGVAAGALGLFHRVHQGAALIEESIGRFGEALLLLARGFEPLLHFAQPVLRAVAPFRPGGDFAKNCVDAGRAGARLVAQARQGGAGFARLRALHHGATAKALQRAGERGRLVERVEFDHERFALLCSLVAIGEGLRLRGFEPRQALADLREAPLRRRVTLARLLQTNAGAALVVTRLRVRQGGEARRLAGGVELLGERIGLGAGAFGLDAQVGEAVLFGEATGGRGRRFSRLGEAVPPPQIALLGDKALAGLEKLAQVLAFGPQHDADLRQTAPQGRRRFDHLIERAHAAGQ